MEDGPVRNDGPVDRILGHVDDAAQACLHNLFPTNTVDNLDPVRSLKRFLFSVLLGTFWYTRFGFFKEWNS